MGYVFTPREFEDGKIPSIHGYQAAMDLLRRGLSELFSKGMIYGSNIHGSNFHSDGGVGSDIDVLVVMNSRETEEYLGNLNDRIKNETSVPVEFVPVLTHAAQKGHHTLDYFYIVYMKTYCKSGIIGNDPASVVSPRESWTNPRREVAERHTAQLTKFSKRKIALAPEYDAEHCDFLENLIRQPIYSAIDVLRIKHGNYPGRNGTPASKAECCELYAREFPELATPDLGAVMAARNKYRRFVQEHRGRPLADYIHLLEEIDGVYPNAINLMERNLDFLSSGLTS